MSAAGIPGIEPDGLTRPFWEACANSKLLIQQCESCKRYQYPPMELCGTCQHKTLVWRESRGVGSINAASTVYRPQVEAFKAPYVVAIVLLDEGCYMISNIVGECALEAKPEDRVTITFTTVRPGYVLPHFRLSRDSDTASRKSS